MPRLSSGGHPTARYFHELPIGAQFIHGSSWWVKQSTRTARFAPESVPTWGSRPYYFRQNDTCTIEVMK